jgi:muconolactone delta-isomerase
MQFMILTRRRTESFDEADYTAERLEAEAEGVRRLFMAGTVRQIWNRADMGGACLLIEAEVEEEVRSVLNALPLFKGGMQETVLIVPLRPYRGFGPRQQRRSQGDNVGL